MTPRVSSRTRRPRTTGSRSSFTDTRAQLSDTEAGLADTQAQLLDAQAQLAQVGELVLEDGTYVGPVLGAHSSPYRIVIFDAGLFRVAQVSQDVTITSGGRALSLSEFGRLLASTGRPMKRSWRTAITR